jgi:hypothetical protein
MAQRILRVFTRKTSMTPTDELVVIGEPTIFEPREGIDEVHVSVLFSWDMKTAWQLQDHWSEFYRCVSIGGPALGLFSDEFVSGRYLRRGITISTRGCDLKCPWCLVSEKEGRFRQLKTIAPGNVVQDNNILLADRPHLEKLFAMLRRQKRIRFAGGLDCRLLTDWHVERLRSLSIHELWLALDHKERMKPFKKACTALVKAGFTRDHIRAYVLAGFHEPIRAAEERLVFAYECGALPFIQVYQNDSGSKRMAGERSREDNLFVWKWSRPAVIKTLMRNGESTGRGDEAEGTQVHARLSEQKEPAEGVGRPDALFR